MPKFALVEIETIKGLQKFFKLVKDGRCEFDEFEAEARIQYNIEMNSIYTRMELMSNNINLPFDKLKNISLKNSYFNEYEFKTRHLRVYAVHEPGTGKIIMFGGYKTTQVKDITHFRELIEQYINFKRLK